MSPRFHPPAWVLIALLMVTGSATRAGDCNPIITFADHKLPLREIFVSPAGNNSSGGGTRDNPFQTIHRARQGVRPGDAIRLLPGTYPAGIYLENLTGTPAAPIWLGGLPGEDRPVISGGSQALHLSRVRYLVVEHLEIAGSSRNGINCDDGGDYDNPDATRHVLFRGLHFRDIGSGGNQDALKLSGVDDYFVLDSHFAQGSDGGSGIDHSQPDLPSPEPSAVIGENPRFADVEAGDCSIDETSPASGRGQPLAAAPADMRGHCYANPPSIGTFEADPPRRDADDKGMPGTL